MTLLFLLVCILILLVYNSSLVISGASYGLMLWYKNVLPMLLPFMLISGLMVRQVSSLETKSKSNSQAYSILVTVILGVLCGYPIGAKVSADFVKNGAYNSKIGNIILPLCNNSSPMFISGYIVYRILNQNVSFLFVMLCIYLPYVILTIICLIIYKSYNTTSKKQLSVTVASTITNVKKKNSTSNQNSTKNNYKISKTKTETSISDYLIGTINQITMVGVYIMICSIAIEFIKYIPYINNPYTAYIGGIIEITRGTADIASLTHISEKIKTALIIAITSYGGISSILQTQMVIEKTGLSIIYYTVMKVICSILSYICCILLI